MMSHTKQLHPAVYLDKDGTLIRDVPYNVDPAKIRLMPQVLEALGLLHQAGYRLVIVSNQSGIAKGLFCPEDLEPVQARIEELLAAENLPLAGFYYCPHHPEGAVARLATRCECRKPEPGLLLQAARELNLDLSRSWMIGDLLNDVEAGHRAGCKSVLFDSGGETEWQAGPLREPDFVAHDWIAAARYILSYGNRPPHSKQPGVDHVCEHC